MRLPRRLSPLSLVTALSLGLTLGLAACSSPDPAEEASDSPSVTVSATATDSLTPTPSDTITADSEPAAVNPDTPMAPLYDETAGVKQAVATYYTVYNRIAQDPAVDPLAIADVALNPEKDRAYAQLTANRQAGHRQIGDIQARVITVLPLESSAVTYLAEVCVDTRLVEVLDSQGRSLWHPDSPRQTFAVFYIERRGVSFLVTEVDHSADPCASV